MASTSVVDQQTGRKFYPDAPDDLKASEPLTFLLSVHGGGSVGAWQRWFVPAHDFKEQHRLVVDGMGFVPRSGTAHLYPTRATARCRPHGQGPHGKDLSPT